MFLTIISLFIINIYGFEGIDVDYTTAIYRNNKLYVYEPYDVDLDWTGLTIYNLKDGLISDIESRLINLTNSNSAYAPQFLQLPETLTDKRSNELWIIGGISDKELKNNTISKENWSGEIINDSELEFNDDFIPMPPFDNFPKSGFSQTIVNNNNNLELYIIGGLVYSKELNTTLITNYFFKYEFSTRKWSDLSEATKSILQPRYLHTVVEVDNSLILVGGIQNNKTLNGNFEHEVSVKDEVDVSDINTIFKFDLKDQKWTTVNTKLNKDPSIYRNGKVTGPSIDIYDGKIVSYASVYNYKDELFEPQIGILDYKTWEWEWHQIKNNIGIDNSLLLAYHNSLIINDQLILVHGLTNQNYNKKLYSINLKTFKFQTFLNISGEYNQNTVLKLPAWAIAIVVLCCILFFILLITTTLFYLRYKKRFKVDDNKKYKMQEVWATACHETEGLKSRAATFSMNKTWSSGGSNNSTLVDESMESYECFQHEVDLEDLAQIKSKIRSN